MEKIVDAVNTALDMLPQNMTTQEALIMLYAIGYQESEFKHRYQVLNTPGLKGPARGFWQFERGGGVVGIMRHPASSKLFKDVCSKLNVPFKAMDIWLALETNDVLAASAARLLLWTDPQPLPKVDDVKTAWQVYLRNWRPGKPHENRWGRSHRAAHSVVSQFYSF